MATERNTWQQKKNLSKRKKKVYGRVKYIFGQYLRYDEVIAGHISW